MSDRSLPADYKEQIIHMLGQEEANAFLDSYEQSRTYGLRINQLKLKSDEAIDAMIQAFKLNPVPWCSTGYYYEEDTRPGKHPYHMAGLYYIQEPSAMSAVELLDPQPGETILDLAAAPGGKTTQIAAKMNGQGLLISNEIHPQRAKILAENVERMGIRGAIVTQATPPELSARFPLAFDRIMLDAPCSGEGMFRKDPSAIEEWSPASVALCASRQWDILQDAIAMLKPGGIIAYSTCTFNRSENEEMIARVLNEYPYMRLKVEKRVWPHLQQGEGHYVAVLERDKQTEEQTGLNSNKEARANKKRGKSSRSGRETSKDLLNAWEAFNSWAKLDLPGFQADGGIPVLFGEALYLLPRSEELTVTMEQLSGIKVPRAGLHLGDYRKGRFVPAHALAMSSGLNSAARIWTLGADSPELAAYLRGETLNTAVELRGWVIVAVKCATDSYPLGWGKASDGQLKNHLPKGLRLMH
ncbi:MAG TPA: RsmB/NOP family class I SAM-dependent RNA methyltransferase [Paenibacillus sp.]